MKIYMRGKTWWCVYYDHATKTRIRRSTRCTDEAAASAVGARYERESNGVVADDTLLVQGPGSFIYFVRAGSRGPIKVGRSTTPAFRIERLQTAAHEPLQLLAVIPGGPSLEKVIHRGLRHSLVRGEWFEPTKLLLKLIEELKATGGAPK